MGDNYYLPELETDKHETKNASVGQTANGGTDLNTANYPLVVRPQSGNSDVLALQTDDNVETDGDIGIEFFDDSGVLTAAWEYHVHGDIATDGTRGHFNLYTLSDTLSNGGVASRLYIGAGSPNTDTIVDNTDNLRIRTDENNPTAPTLQIDSYNPGTNTGDIEFRDADTENVLYTVSRHTGNQLQLDSGDKKNIVDIVADDGYDSGLNIRNRGSSTFALKIDDSQDAVILFENGTGPVFVANEGGNLELARQVNFSSNANETSDGMNKDPETGTEDAYLTVRLNGTEYEIRAYATA